MNSTKLRTLFTAAMVVLVAFAGTIGMVGTAAAANATGINTGTSDWDGTNTVQINTSDSHQEQINVSFDSTLSGDAVLEVIDTRGNDTVVFTSTDYRVVTASNDVVINVTDDQMERIPVNAGDTNTLKVKVYDAGDSAGSAHTWNQTFQAPNHRGAVLVSNYTVKQTDLAELKTTKRLGIFDGRKVANIEDEAVFPSNVNQTEQQVYYIEDSDVLSRAQTASQDATSGDLMRFVDAEVDGKNVETYEGSAPSDVGSNTTYVVYDEGKQAFTFHFPENDSQRSYDVRLGVNDKLSIWGAFTTETYTVEELNNAA